MAKATGDVMGNETGKQTGRVIAKQMTVQTG